MNPRTWVIRCGLLLAGAALLAGAQAALQPMPASYYQRSTAKPAAPTTAAGSVVSPAAADAHAAEVAGAKKQFDESTALFIDARPLENYREGHVPGAFHLDFQAFSKGTPETLGLLPRDFPLIVYCDGGDCDASHKVKTMLEANGYNQVTVLEAGFPGWKSANLPVETGDPAH